MRALAILIIAATAVLLGTLWFEPECKGGRVFASEDACAATNGYGRAFCARVFVQADDAILKSGNYYQSQSDCQMRHPVCIAYPGVHGWTPKPAGFCIVKGAADDLQRMTPVYR